MPVFSRFIKDRDIYSNSKPYERVLENTHETDQIKPDLYTSVHQMNSLTLTKPKQQRKRTREKNRLVHFSSIHNALVMETRVNNAEQEHQTFAK